MNKAGIKKAISIFCCGNLLWILFMFSAHAAPHQLEYLKNYHPVYRVEPKGHGTVYDVCFYFLRGNVGEAYAALEGHGVGKEQWLSDPCRDDYTFVGWYGNPERTGSPYTLDTPIYENTDLYAKWKYTGPGGCWPRSHRGVIHGIEEGSRYAANQTISITADGYNMHLIKPNDQRFRWIPIGWKVSDSITGDFSEEVLFIAEFSVGAQGEYMLYITYKEEIFDGADWQATGQICEVEELSFQVL